MVELVRMGGDRVPVQLVRVAEITGISRRYLEQLAFALKSHSLLAGICGRNGGYVLVRPPNEITIGSVIAAVIGPVRLSTCVVDPGVCMRSGLCECQAIWSLLNLRINSVLEEYTIADMLDRGRMAAVSEEVHRHEVQAPMGGVAEIGICPSSPGE